MAAIPSDGEARLAALLVGRRVALAHHWLVARRGGERVLDVIAQVLPGAELYTLLADADCPRPPGLAALHQSALARLPLARHWFRATAPWHGRLFARFDLSGAALVVSSDAALAKAVRAPPGVPHLCYCYSPPRWAWDLQDTYLAAQPAPLRPLLAAGLARVREADRRAAQGVTEFLACSRHVARRIEAAYGRPAQVLPPPVDTDYFTPPPEGAQTTGGRRDRRPYLLLGEAVAYKRFEVAVAACRALHRELIVAGSARGLARLSAAAGPATRFIADPSDEQVLELYRGARALLFPGEEDFGLVPVEAAACGTPVVALARGGATETVIDGESGVLYEPAAELNPSAEVAALVAGLQRFEALEEQLAPQACRRAALRFAPARFRAEFAERLLTHLAPR